MAPDELRDAVLYQLGALDGFAQAAGSHVSYVKPHGALYHAVAAERHARRRARGRGSSSTTRRWRCSACRARRCSRRPMQRASKRCRRRSPTAPIAPTAASCRAGSTGSVLHRPERHRRTRAVRMAVDSEVVAADGSVREGQRPARCACTATHPAPWRSPGRCATRSTRPASASDRFAALTCNVDAVGPAAWLLDDVDDPAAWAASLRGSRVDGVIEIVPAETHRARRLRPVPARRAAGGRRRRHRVGSIARTLGPTVTIDVVYDGADLAAVAEATGLDVDEVIARHCVGRVHGGVLRLQPRLRLPDGPRPRPADPSTRHARAPACRRARWPSPADYTSVYPSASPGGWHLLGHDRRRCCGTPQRPQPALLAPGTTVRFRRSIDDECASVSSKPDGRRPCRTSVASGSRTSGCRVPAPSTRPAMLVNRLVGNDAGDGGARDRRWPGRRGDRRTGGRHERRREPTHAPAGRPAARRSARRRRLGLPGGPRRHRGRTGARLAQPRHAVGRRSAA